MAFGQTSVYKTVEKPFEEVGYEVHEQLDAPPRARACRGDTRGLRDITHPLYGAVEPGYFLEISKPVA